MNQQYEQNHYERLGVAEDAEQEEIKEAHKRRVWEKHPDRHPLAEREHFDRETRLINEAYQTLKDPEKRARYNVKLHDQRHRRNGSDARESTNRRTHRRAGEGARPTADDQRRRRDRRAQEERREQEAKQAEEHRRRAEEMYRRARQAAEEAARQAEEERREREAREEAEEHRRRAEEAARQAAGGQAEGGHWWGGWRRGVLAAGFAVIVAVIVWLMNLPAPQAPVPYVVGDTRYEAEQALGASGFEMEVETREVPEEDVGEVVGQDPSPGSEDNEGSTVTITVGEPTRIDVPDLFGTAQDEAERYVGEDFRIEESASKVSDEPEGDIISQNPAAGLRAEAGSDISVITSAGQPPNPGDIFADDFSNTSSGWGRGTFDDGDVLDYADGRYRIYAGPPKGGIAAWVKEAGTNVEDAIVEVDATRTGDAPSDQGSSWSVMCRGVDGDNGYMMGIRYDGRPFIGKFKDGEFSELATDSRSPAIKQGSSETNHIRGDCVGSKLTLYVNDQKLLEANDADFGSGRVGLLVGNGGNELPGTDVLFDNFQVSTPP